MKYLILVLLLISPLRLLAEKENYYYKSQEKNTSLEVGMAAGYNFINEIDNVELEDFLVILLSVLHQHILISG